MAPDAVGGKGIRVGVIDNGIASHPDLNVVASFKFNDVAGTDRTHGTPVAGIIAARKNDSGTHGVAFNADLVDLSADSGNGSFWTNDTAAAIRAAAGLDSTRPNAKVDVINMSLGGSSISQSQLQAMRDAASVGVLMAISTGNSGGSQPLYPARHVTDSQVRGYAIAVGALDPSDTSNTPRASFSNACGDAMDYCLFAPGVLVQTTSALGGTQNFSGTSAAAPYVSGALAVTLAAFPTRAPNQIVERILATADDLGAPGVDAIYGHGALNLGAALSPVGPLSIPISSGQTSTNTRVSSVGTLSTGTAFGTLAASGALKDVMLYDSMRFPFILDLSGMVTSTAAVQRNVASYLQTDPKSKRDNTSTMNLFGLQSQISFGFAEQGDSSLGRNVDLQGLIDPAQLPLSFSTVASPVENSFTTRNSLGASFALSANLQASISFQSNSHVDQPANEFDPTAINHTLVNTEKAYSRAGITYDFAGATIMVGAGLLDEQDGLLNSKGTGALQLAESAQSAFTEVGIKYALTQNVTVFGTYTQGWINPHLAESSIWRGATDLTANAISVGANVTSLFVANDKLTLVVGQPLRVNSGTGVVEVATGETADGRVITTERTFGLAPSGQEISIQAGYGVNITDAWSLGFGVFTRLEPNHDASAEPEYGAAFKTQLRF